MTSPDPALEQNALSTGGPTDSASSRFSHPKPAPLFEMEQESGDATAAPSAADKLIELLSGLMSQPNARGGNPSSARSSWNARRALVCIPEDKRETLARSLAERGYQVFVAEDTRQAVERMRENQLDVVVVDPRFDAAEQGAVFVTREVNILRPAQRRRLFFVLLSPTLRTMDSHSAFLNNVNAVVNVQDMAELPSLVELRLRDFNELYKDLNQAMNVAPL
ncbi:MAG TPA: hypothetical protein VJU86_18495 [Pyrinomonadaceae bacterium]|nr:hypothetical protein [Pyrinomonadaceae bacterium]